MKRNYVIILTIFLMIATLVSYSEGLDNPFTSHSFSNQSNSMLLIPIMTPEENYSFSITSPSYQAICNDNEIEVTWTASADSGIKEFNAWLYAGSSSESSASCTCKGTDRDLKFKNVAINIAYRISMRMVTNDGNKASDDVSAIWVNGNEFVGNPACGCSIPLYILPIALTGVFFLTIKLKKKRS